MIPAYIDIPGSPWPILPPGIHDATLEEIETRFASNPGRREQFTGLIAALINLQRAGCQRAFLDGSFVTAKPRPGDFDACWDPAGVNKDYLDPVLLTFENNRAAQKAKYHGEFFPPQSRPIEPGQSSSSFSRLIDSQAPERASWRLILRPTRNFSLR